MDLSWIAIVVQLIFLEGILSIDNAAVLGAMAASLSAHQPIPWPRLLRTWGQRLDPLLGGQRPAALKVGLLGAYAGRGLMLLVAHGVAETPWLHLLGGGYLIYLAVTHSAASESDKRETAERLLNTGSPRNFWQVVAAIEATDLIFSLDNVVAAVSLSSHILVVMLGVALGILTMRFAAGIFAALIEREPVLESAAYLLLLAIGVRFFLERIFHFEVSALVQFGISVLMLATALLYAHWMPLRRVLRPVLALFQRLAHAGQWLLRCMLIRPLGSLLSLIVTLFREGMKAFLPR